MQIIIWLAQLFEERNALLKYLCCIQVRTILNLKNILQEKKTLQNKQKNPPRIIKFNAGIYKVKLKQLKNSYWKKKDSILRLSGLHILRK